jgi:hypothetical protein
MIRKGSVTKTKQIEYLILLCLLGKVRESALVRSEQIKYNSTNLSDF